MPNSIDLIVLGKRRYSSLKEVLLGSKVTRIIKNSDIPVLCVPYSTEQRSLDNIVLLSDSVDLSVSLKLVLPLVETCKGKINVLRLLPPDSHISESTLDWKTSYLTNTYFYPNIECCETLTNDVLNGIHIWAEEHHVSLIAVYPRRTSILNTFDEDMALDILQASRIPVYIGKF